MYDQERFVLSTKHAVYFPLNAIQFCLSKGQSLRSGSMP